MTSSEKPAKWLSSLQDFIKHDKINLDYIKSSALIVIDMQNFFTDEKSHAFVPSSKAIIPNINDLIEAYSNAGLTVLFTYYALEKGEDPASMGRWWKDTVWEKTPEAGLSPEINTRDDSIIIRKSTYDSFYNTDLLNILKEKNVDTVIITGVMTHLCCETTARSAFVNNFNVYFVIDANATVNEELHLSSIRTLSDGFAVPCITSQMISAVHELKKEGE
jgi:nicotinamidase-related amidase